MVFWWTRKPLVSARAIIAASLLPNTIDKEEFIRAMHLDKNTPHKFSPTLSGEMRSCFEGKRVLDPFAGYGSMPLEALRLGLSTAAVELLPTAFVFLKSILDYPLKYGEQLTNDVSRYGAIITNQLRKDPQIKSLYDDNALYIGSWEVKCPHCLRWTPLIGNFWLARVKKSTKGYSELAWFTAEKKEGELKYKVIDLADEYDLSTVVIDGNKIAAGTKEFKVQDANINPKSESATCLRCNGTIRFIDPETGKHYLEKKGLPKDVVSRLVWYVKYALSSFNQGKSDVARHAVLIRVKSGKGLTFEPCENQDQARLDEAKEIILRLIENTDPDIPIERLAPYGTTAIGGYLQPINYNMNQWYQLFNPRQLLLHTKLVKLIRNAGKALEQEKSASMSSEEALAYSEAVTTYLAIALASEVDFNSLTSRWEKTKWTKVNRTFTARGVSMVWNWCDSSPFSGYVGSWTNCVRNVIDGLEYLVEATTRRDVLRSEADDGQAKTSHQSQQWPRSTVELDDATVLAHFSANDKFDLIATDPPYYSDVPYSELSDFYFVWLKRALSDVAYNKLIPRYLTKAFYKNIGGQSVEIETQWETFSTREVSLNPPRLGERTTFEDGIKHFQSLLDSAFLTMNSFLKEEGLLVTYYAHTSPEAWKALLRSGWQVSGSRVTNAFPLTTESGESIIKRGKLSLDTSIVVVWRKGASGSIQASELYDLMIEASRRRTESSIEMKLLGSDLFVGALVAALSQATRYRDVLEMKRLDTSELMDRYVYRASLHGLVKAISQRARVEEGIRSSEGMLYLVTKFLYLGSAKKIITNDDARIFSIGTGIDLVSAVNTLRLFRSGSEDEEGEGSSLAKRKTLVLLEPQSKDRTKLRDLLYYRGLDTENPIIRSSVDALQLMEYYALANDRKRFSGLVADLKTKYPSETDEAMGLARVISGSLSDDAEGELCTQVITKAGGERVDLERYLGE